MPIKFFRCVSLVFLAFSLNFYILSAHATQSELKPQLQKILDSAVSKSKVTPGAVLLISSPTLGSVAVASGFADKQTKTPMSIQNNFRLASISKTFLAVMILKLSAENVLQLEDKIAGLLPKDIEVERIPNGSQVTVRQLLAMRSGIPNYSDYSAYTEFVKNNANHRWIPQDGVQMIYDEEPSFAPGKDYEYSNTNYILLQSIIEEVTHSTLAKQLRQTIFDPLHLTHTYQEVQEQQAGGFNGLLTHGYDVENKQLKDVTEFNDGFGMGDGGIVSTAQDLATFVQALLQTKRLLPPSLLNEMLSVEGPDKYGLGIYQEEVDGSLAWTHNGTTSGFAGQFYYFPDQQLTLVILTNSFESDIIDDVAAATFELISNSS